MVIRRWTVLHDLRIMGDLDLLINWYTGLISTLISSIFLTDILLMSHYERHEMQLTVDLLCSGLTPGIPKNHFHTLRDFYSYCFNPRGLTYATVNIFHI